MTHLRIRGRSGLAALAWHSSLVAAGAVACLSIAIAAAPIAAAASPNSNFLLSLTLLQGHHHCLDRPGQRGPESLWHRRCDSDGGKARGR